MTLDELKRESFYQALSDGQKKFVIARCSGSDLKTAAKEAWACMSDASATAMANKVMKNANVSWLINKFLGVGASRCSPTQREMGDWLWEKAQGCTDPKLALSYATLFCDISGYKTKPADPTIKPTADDGDEEYTPR